MKLDQEIETISLRNKAYYLYLSQLYAVRCLYAKSFENNYSTAHSLSFFLCVLNLTSLLMVVDYFFGNFIADNFWGKNLSVPKVAYGVLLGLLSTAFILLILKGFRKIPALKKINIQRKVLSNKFSLAILGLCYLFLSIAFFVIGMNYLFDRLFGQAWI